MKLVTDQKIERLRLEVRAFIDANRPALNTAAKAGVRAPEPEDIPSLRKWAGKLFTVGYIGADWPAEWGGSGTVDPVRAAVVGEEMARARAPMPVGAGLLAAMALIHYGSLRQKAQFLPRIRSAEDIWCQLFSEPEAGSDLASLRTRATRDGDWFIVDGQKVWTTVGQHAQLGYLLARTGPDEEKHAGITAFIVDMAAKGVDVRPLREITGSYDFNEVFFDGVRVPAENVIGAVGQGWQVATASLVHERSSVGTTGVVTVQAVSDAAAIARAVQRDCKPALETDDVRQALGRLYAAARITGMLGQYNLSRTHDGTADAADAPLAKVFHSETNLALADFGLGLLGTESLLTADDPEAVEGGWWQDAFLYARAYTIAGGANEVLRNMIAERALGLPREPRSS